MLHLKCFMCNYSEILFPQNNKTSLWYFAGKLNHILIPHRYWYWNRNKYFALNWKGGKIVLKFYLFSIQTNLKQIELNFQSILAPLSKCSSLLQWQESKGKCDLLTFLYDNIFVFQMTSGHWDSNAMKRERDWWVNLLSFLSL